MTRDENVQEIKEIAGKMVRQYHEATCETCLVQFLCVKGEEAKQCPGCAEKERFAKEIASQSARIREKMDEWLPKWLERAGMSKRETAAELRRIPEFIRKRLPEGAGEMIHGVVPMTGFGLSGGAGVGKTFAIAALIAQMVKVQWRARGREIGFHALRRSLIWVNWPATANKWRMMSTEEQGHGRVKEIVDDMKQQPVFMLDDLGVERMRGTYEEDWATSLLDLVIDARYNAMLPIWYTTNLSEGEILDRYGSRFASRLCGENRVIELPDSRDLRVLKGGR